LLQVRASERVAVKKSPQRSHASRGALPETAFTDLARLEFRHACKLGFEGIVSKRLGSPYVSGRSRHWIKSKNPAAPAVKREAEEDWRRQGRLTQ
jgi:ATP-dependent DNA ligase